MGRNFRGIARALGFGLVICTNPSLAGNPEVGKLIKVEPAGTFYKPSGIKFPTPTRIYLKDYGVSAGDYISVQPHGKLIFERSTIVNHYTVDMLFMDARGNGYPPADYGDVRAIKGRKCFPQNSAFNSGISAPSQNPNLLIARIPAGSTSLAFSMPGKVYCDDPRSALKALFDQEGDYGVLLGRPNSKPKGTSKQVYFLPKDVASAETEPSTVVKTPCREIPTTLHIPSPPPVPDPQYRGYTMNGGKVEWKPLSSEFGRRSGIGHCGIDIFSPKFSPFFAPVDGTVESFEKPITCKGGKPGIGICGYGRTLLLKFRYPKGPTGKPYMLLFAHLAKIDVNNGDVKQGDRLGEVGCSGNAQAVGCGFDLNTLGGRSDHLHVELIDGWHLVVKEGKREKTARRLPVDFIMGWGTRRPE